ncbi:MAG TPA: DUF5615 family PIN-like protein [Rhizomicrobium sp.]|jgi:predicted nuclease of predicted toxin-antitoxin system|nr:DUF5615 family PIN-like protein [Rhizomicrobium sp.]
MRWLADECVHATVVAELRKAGHDVIFAMEDAQQSKDIDLADWAFREGRLLLTEDKDFGDIVFQQNRQTSGIVLLRIPPARRAMKWPQLKAVIDRFGDTLHQRYLVVEETRIRARLLDK